MQVHLHNGNKTDAIVVVVGKQTSKNKQEKHTKTMATG